MDSNDRRGAVRWVIPKNNSSLTKDGNIRRKSHQPAQSPTYSCDSEEYIANNLSQQGRHPYNQATRHAHGESSTPNSISQRDLSNQFDMSTCRTISVIIDQYIKELREHQDHINSARLNLVAALPHHSRDENYISPHDLSRIKVRSEQTKATETIKQLTSYLRELSHIKNQMESMTDMVDEDTLNRLSDIRNSIIQALNDFVLANTDIEFPIIGDDPNGGEYDLCIDAQKFLNGRKSTRLPPISDTTNSDAGFLSDRTNIQDGNLLMVKQDESKHTNLAEKRLQEVQKLERDTLELKRLFADFYDLVKVQGEQIDTIEDNIMMAAQQISEGRNHLANRPMRGMTMVLPVTGCVTGALIGGPIGFLIGGKLGGLTIVCASSLLGLLSSLGAQKCIVDSGSNEDKAKYD